MPKIRIVRGDGYADRFRAYNIFIDGQKRGLIKRNEKREFEVSEGEHDVQLKIDWCGSQKINVQSGRNGLDLICGPGARPPFTGLFYMLLRPNKWVTLREID